MIDSYLRPMIDRPLNRMGRLVARIGLSADGVTMIGFGFGLSAVAIIAGGEYLIGGIFILLNRLFDGLDGAVARATKPTQSGGFLDIVLDFFFYGLVPVGFAIADPARNGAAAAFLLASFYANGSAFLAFSIFAEKYKLTSDAQGIKSLYYMSGIAEGFETIVVFVLFCLYPNRFAELAIIFGFICFVSAGARCVNGYLLVRNREVQPQDESEEHVEDHEHYDQQDDPADELFADLPEELEDPSTLTRKEE